MNGNGAIGALIHRFRSARKSDQLVVLEGFHAIKHAVRFGAQIQEVITADRQQLAMLASAMAPDLAVYLADEAILVAEDVLVKIAPKAPRTGAMAIAVRPKNSVDDLLADKSAAPVVLLEDPRNLGNLGACVRAAAGADVAGVLATGRSDPWHPDAVRGAAGLQFALPVARVDSLPEQTHGRCLVAIDPDGEIFDPRTLSPRSVLAFGTERHGLSDTLLASADRRCRIPMRHGVSSLNLATTVSAVLFSWRLACDH